jgi:hypothetical protein
MTQRITLIWIVCILNITKSYCQGDYFHGMSSSWIDSTKYYIILKQVSNSDYAYITESIKVIYGKDFRSYKIIAQKFDFITLNTDSKKATRYKIEKILQKQNIRYDTDTNSNLFKIKKVNWNYKRTVNFFTYIDSLGFYKLDNDSLTNKCGLPDSTGTKNCSFIPDTNDEIIYLKNKLGYHDVRSLLPEFYIEKYPENNEQRKIFVLSRNKYKELVKK